MIPDKILNPDDFHPERKHIVLSTMALSIISLALPIMTLQIYDRILPNPESGTLPVLVVGVSIAILVEICLRLARAWIIGWNGAVYEHAMSSAAMQHILAADVLETGSYGIGEFLNRLSSIGKIKDFYSGYALMTMTELAFVPVFLGVIFYIAPPLAVIPAALLATFTAVSWVQGKRLRRELDKRDVFDDKRYDFLIECLKGIHTIKAFAIEKLLARRYEALQEKSGLASFHAAEASAASFNAGTCLSHLMMVMIMTIGAIFAIHGQITTGALIATLQLSGRLMQPVQRALVLWAKYQDYHLARQKVGAIFQLPLHRTLPANGPIPEPAGSLIARNVSFGASLKDINLTVSMGETIAISGLTGSGKTELLEILSGLYNPDSGEVLIDGMDIRCYTPEELAKHVGYMATEGVIFRGSIRDNITRFGTIPEMSAREVTALLSVDRDVAKLPAGFDTVLQADGADQVSPGLRQRIAMTRTLASRPKIILYDEADRSIDRSGYNLIFSLLARLRRKTAMIIVSDDANITDLATRHYTLRAGTLVEGRSVIERKIVS